ncbi:MAG: hypothetical protein MUP76_01270 [Acidimicrobiia bacterium]|nr:hypothetical protein [Acidimicrobiia bacterium]
MTSSRRTAPHRLPGAVAIGLAVAVAVYAAAFVAVPSARHRLAIEDGIIETTTALVFMGSAVFGTIGMLTGRHRPVYWVIPVAGLLGFLDEMRFGGRIFGYSLPGIDGREIDSLHDLLAAAMQVLGVTRTHLAVIAAVAGAAGVGLLLTGRRLRRLPAWVATHRPLALMAGALAMLAVGFAFDQLGSTTAALFAEETSEFAASGLVAMAAADLLVPAEAGPFPLSGAGDGA